MDAFGEYGEVWEYNVGPHELNDGEVDGEIEFGPYVEDDLETSVEELGDDE